MTGENIEDLFIIASKLLYNNFKDKIAQMVSKDFEFICLTFLIFQILQKDEAMKKRKNKKLKKQAERGTAQYKEEQAAKKGRCCR